jgi:hypothetical protein
LSAIIASTLTGHATDATSETNRLGNHIVIPVHADTGRGRKRTHCSITAGSTVGRASRTTETGIVACTADGREEGIEVANSKTGALVGRIKFAFIV